LDASYSLSCLYALKGVSILLASLIEHSQLEVSVGQCRSRTFHLLIFSHVQYLWYNSSCHAIMLPLCAPSVDISTRLNCLVGKRFVIFIQVGIYVCVYTIYIYYTHTHLHTYYIYILYTHTLTYISNRLISLLAFSYLLTFIIQE
jgi:hypothetical protein